MVKEYQMPCSWQRSTEDENLQLEALFDALYMAGKVSEQNLFIHTYSSSFRQGYLYPKREAALAFLRYHSTYDKDFWDKMNCYNHSPLDLADQIYQRTLKAAENEEEGTATYTCTGAPAVNGTIVCMGKTENGQYITNPADGAPRQFIKDLNPTEILLFLGKYSKWLKDPLLMFGVWRTYGKGDYGPWLMCLCHHLGTGRRADYYEYAFCAEYAAIDYTGKDFYADTRISRAELCRSFPKQKPRR